MKVVISGAVLLVNVCLAGAMLYEDDLIAEGLLEASLQKVWESFPDPGAAPPWLPTSVRSEKELKFLESGSIFLDGHWLSVNENTSIVQAAKNFFDINGIEQPEVMWPIICSRLLLNAPRKGWRTLLPDGIVPEEALQWRRKAPGDSFSRPSRAFWSRYWLSVRKLEDEMARRGVVAPEGHSAQAPRSVLALQMALSRNRTARTVCEVGFNGGHSALAWLTTRKDLKVVSFDLGKHEASAAAESLLKEWFGEDSIEVIWGDSLKTIPDTIGVGGSRPDISCDILFVDGGHEFHHALSDSYHLMQHVFSRYKNVPVAVPYLLDDSLEAGDSWMMGITRAAIRLSEEGWYHVRDAIPVVSYLPTLGYKGSLPSTLSSYPSVSFAIDRFEDVSDDKDEILKLMDGTDALPHLLQHPYLVRTRHFALTYGSVLPHHPPHPIPPPVSPYPVAVLAAGQVASAIPEFAVQWHNLLLQVGHSTLDTTNSTILPPTPSSLPPPPAIAEIMQPFAPQIKDHLRHAIKTLQTTETIVLWSYAVAATGESTEIRTD